MDKIFDATKLTSEHRDYTGKTPSGSGDNHLDELISGEQVGESLGKTKRWLEILNECKIDGTKDTYNDGQSTELHDSNDYIPTSKMVKKHMNTKVTSIKAPVSGASTKVDRNNEVTFQQASGQNPAVTVTGNATNGTVTIEHQTGAGYNHIPSSGSTGQYLRNGGTAGSATWTSPLTSWPTTPEHTDVLPSTKLLDDRFKTNETNISYAIETGSINLSSVTGFTEPRTTPGFTSYYAFDTPVPTGEYRIICDVVITDTSKNDQFRLLYSLPAGSDSINIIPVVSNGHFVSNKITLTKPAVGLDLYVNSPTTISNLMIVDEIMYQAGLAATYQPYAIPNYDLTRMVSELQKKSVKVYTYHVNPNESDPEDAVTYLDDAAGLTPAKMGSSSFSYGSWANAWFLPRPCVLKFDGTVDYYLNPNDYTQKTDGTDATITENNTTGNVMLEFPKIWVKRVNDGNGARTVSIAPVNVDGTYKCWSNINAEDKEVDHFYLPAYNGTIHSSKMRSLSGVTLNTTYAPNYTRAQEVTAATANNPTGKNLWYTETWADFCLIYDLLYLMGKSLDLQRTFGQGLSTGSETAMRAYVTGTHNAKGLFYGDISGTSTAVKVLGMENLWGCRWHGVAGLINDNGTLKVKMTYGVADGSTTVGYNTTGSGYLNYGSTYGTNGYVKKMQADNTMGYKIIETAGTDATYYCDYYYTNNSQLNYALLGGGSGDGSGCGFCVGLRDGAGRAFWPIGGALSCRP